MVDRPNTFPASTSLSVEAVARVGEVLPDGLSVIDARGVHLEVNGAFCTMVGRTREELIGKTAHDLYWPEEEAESIQAAMASTLDGDFDHFRLTFRRANGERFPVIVSPNVVRDEAGQPAFYFASIKDISPIVRADEALRQSEQRYRTLADSTPYGIAVHVAGIVRYVNAAAIELLGATESEILGEPVSRFVHPDDQEMVAARVRALTEGGPHAPWARERFRRYDGSHFYADVAGTRVQFQDQPAVQVAFRDVSQELERERLQAQTNRLEAIGRLAGGVAHDFNNLLTVVMAACSFAIDDDELPPDLREDLESAHQAARHGAALTSQLLAFSRQEPLELTSLMLGRELQRIAKVLERMVGEDIAVALEVTPDCWPLRADRTQLERVLLNLVANARAAMPSGGCLRIRAANAPAGTLDPELNLPSTQDFVRMDVSDDGLGMDEATRAQVFEPFFTTRRAEGGTGLGLATVYGIVTHSGGTVAVDSEVGKGTRISLFWPRAGRPVADLSPAETLRAVGAETVLVVEDQAPVRHVVVRALERDGYTVLEAEGYTDALEWLEGKATVDVLLTDIVLRDRTGPAVVDAALALRPQLPVLFMSGFADVDVLSADHAARPRLQKPFSPASLSDAVRAVLEDADRDE